MLEPRLLVLAGAKPRQGRRWLQAARRPFDRLEEESTPPAWAGGANVTLVRSVRQASQKLALPPSLEEWAG